MTREKFEKLVQEGIKAIPKRFLDKLDNIDIVIEEEPTSFQLKKLRAKKSLILFGLYEGIPKIKRWHYSQVLPDKITIFKGPIERYAKSESQIRELVKNTVWHEIAHHFGISERGVRKLEKNRREKQ